MHPKRIALTGGIATGKSTVAGMLAELGARVLDADQVAREVVEVGSSCWKGLRELLGPTYFDADGRLVRRKLRESIIRDRECRSRVNAILHPAILDAMHRAWAEANEASPEQPVIFDIPLLYETGQAKGFDLVILVYVPVEIQIERLMDRDGLSRTEAERTLTMQLPIEEKKGWADLVIDNSLTPEDTYRQVLTLWESLTSAQPGAPG